MGKKIYNKILLGLLLIIASFGNAQNVSFNSTSNPPNASAVLDLSGCINGGFVLPWMTVLQMNSIANPITSLLVYDDTTNCYYAYYSGSSSWVKCYCLCNASPATPGTISGTSSSIVPGTTESYSVAAVSGATSYTWVLPNNDTIITGTGTNSITAYIGCGGAGTITVAASNSCGNSATKTLAIATSTTSAPSNPSSISGSTTPTEGSSQTYTASTTTNTTYYSWTVPTGVGGYTITSGQGTATITVTVGCATGNITVSAENNCGASSGRSVSINPSNPSTPGAISGPASYCANSTASYYVSAVAGATTYSWTFSGFSGGNTPTISSGSGTDSIIVAMKASTSTGTISVTASDACGNTSSASTISVTKTTSAPAAPTITGPTQISVSTTGNTYIATSSGASSFTWTVPAAVGTITSGQGTATITVTAAGSNGSGSITATATNGCGISTAGSLAVTTSTCSGTILVDNTVISSSGTKTVTITTANANEVVLIMANGISSSVASWSGTITVSGGGSPTVTVLKNTTTNDGDFSTNLVVAGFIAATATTYTITIPQSNNDQALRNCAVALYGFCNTATLAANVTAVTVGPLDDGTEQSTISASITPTVANSYIVANYFNFSFAQALATWTSPTGYVILGTGSYDNNYTYDGSIAGYAEGTAAAKTFTVNDPSGGGNMYMGALQVVDVHN